ncbi:MAG TPA: lasso RiPP family leader peptide-containing protein [Pseudonocardia sp.]|jgi:hypothetical protein|nr:lasso RiPP family leader peptide-containing protein [Pseudonocardia sp.]
MDEQVYEAPALVELGEFTEETLGGPRSRAIDTYFLWY